MKKLLFVVFAFLFQTTMGQDIPVIKFHALQSLMEQKYEKVLVINFWATWCGPCVKELPVFERLNQNDESAKVFLINLDFAEKLDRVKAFVQKKNMRSSVMLLDEIDYNSWIDKVDRSWSGAIPATLIINPKTGKRKFVEKELTDEELQELIKSTH